MASSAPSSSSGKTVELDPSRETKAGLRPTRSLAASSRIAELDALRGLAAMSVLLYHYLTRYQEMYGRQHPVGLDFNAGGFGVCLFFMLSGFVIFMTLDRSRCVWDFVLSRCSRLFPTFWAAAIVTFLVTRKWGLPDQIVSVHDAVINLSMLPRLSRAEMIDGVYWSLEPELFFYLCMGTLLFLGGLKRIRVVLAVWLALGIISHIILTTQDASGTLYRLTGKFKTACALEYIHFFAVGLIFYDVRRHGTWTLGHKLLLALAAAMTVWLCQPWESVIAMALGLVLYLATIGRLPWLNARALLWLGFISYPLYLTHQNMGYIALHWMDEHGWNPYLATAVLIPCAIAVAAVFSYSVEHPIMRKTRELMKKRRAAAGPSLTSTTQPAITNASL